MSVEQKLVARRKKILGALRLALQKVSARLLAASPGAGRENWHLMGRCVGQVEKELSQLLSQVNDPQSLDKMAERLVGEQDLLAQVRAAYLFARAHSQNDSSQAEVIRQLAFLEEAGGSQRLDKSRPPQQKRKGPRDG